MITDLYIFEERDNRLLVSRDEDGERKWIDRSSIRRMQEVGRTTEHIQVVADIEAMESVADIDVLADKLRQKAWFLYHQGFEDFDDLPPWDAVCDREKEFCREMASFMLAEIRKAQPSGRYRKWLTPWQRRYEPLSVPSPQP